jgi:hypothetical protein
MRKLLVVVLWLMPTLAWAEWGGQGRASGFMLETEIGLSSPYVVRTPVQEGYVLAHPFTRPRLLIGGQIGRFAVGAFVAMSVGDVFRDDDPDPDRPAAWAMHFGPSVDFEFWGRGPAGLYLAFAIPVYLGFPDRDESQAGFGLDVGLGGRVFVARQLAVSVKMGSLLSFLWFDHDRGPARDEGAFVGWSLYGAIAVRFVAG